MHSHMYLIIIFLYLYIYLKNFKCSNSFHLNKNSILESSMFNIPNIIWFFFDFKLISCFMIRFFYFLSSLFDFTKTKRLFIYNDMLNFTMDLFIVDLFYKIKNLDFNKLIILTFVFWITSYNISFFIGFCQICILIINVKILVIFYIYNNDKLNGYRLHTFIKYFLFFLIIIHMIIFIYILFTNLYKMFIKDYKWWTNIKNIFQNLSGNRSPQQDPNNNNSYNFYTPSTKDKKKKASELHDKLIEVQKRKVQNKDYVEIKESLLQQKRDWKHKVTIDKSPEISLQDQINKINNEWDKYDKEGKKFKKIISDIKKGEERFYPDESKSLFKDYLLVIKNLKSNLKSMHSNLTKKK